MQKLFDDLSQSVKGTVLRDEPMSRHTTFRIGGPADILLVPSSVDDLVEAVKLVRAANIPLTVIGNGSNLLVSDSGIRGVVIKVSGAMEKISFNGSVVTAEAGVKLQKLIAECAEKGLSGLEYFAGIPSALGGALAMNLGGSGKNIGDLVKNVTVVTGSGGIITLPHAECGFAYRSAGFAAKSLAVLKAELLLKPSDSAEIKNMISGISALKAASQPLNIPSAGCIFKNPHGHAAGELIEKAGLKGRVSGGAGVSAVHANYIVNNGWAKASDVVSLIDAVKSAVKDKFGIALETEVKMLGF